MESGFWTSGGMFLYNSSLKNNCSSLWVFYSTYVIRKFAVELNQGL